MQAVAYTLQIAGSPAPPRLLEAVQLIEVESHVRLADMLRLRLALALRGDGDGWRFLDEDLFPRLAEVRLSVTVGSGAATPLIDARVIDVRPHFANAPGESVLDVIAMDATVLMNLEEKVRGWPGMADSDIATTIFGDYNLAPDVVATQPTRQEADTTMIQRASDIQFLRYLADRNGYEVHVETNPDTGAVEGHFHPPRVDGEPQGVLSVSLGTATNVNWLKVRHDMLRPTTAAATGLDVETLNEQPADVSAVTLGPLGGKSALAADRPRRLLLAGEGLFQAGELQTYAQAVVDRSAWALTAEGELNTVAYGGVLRPRRPVMVRGAGPQLSGAWYVEKVLHVLTGEGYLQRFALRRNAVGVQSRDSFVDSDALPA